jgi:hypothetical protein
MVEVQASEGFLRVLREVADELKAEEAASEGVSEGVSDGVSEGVCKEARLQLTGEERALLLREAEAEAGVVTVASVRLLLRLRPRLPLHQTLRGSRLVRPLGSQQQEAAEKAAARDRQAGRRSFLQRQHETREYNRMVHGSARLLSDNEETISNAIQSVKYQAAISSNMLAAVSE